MTSSIKITSLTDIGANLSTTSLVPVVNMSGVPETQKANLQIVGNLILNGAGTSFPSAAQALLAQTVTNAAQPNITSVGTLSALNVSGNITTGNLVAGNIIGTVTGSATTAGTVTTNAQPNITSVGNLTGLTVTGVTNLGDIGNVKITGGSAGQVLSTDGAGNLSWASDANSSYGDSNVTSLLASFGSNAISTTGNVDTGNVNASGTVATTVQADAVGAGATLGVRSTLNVDPNFGSNDPNNPASAQAVRGRIAGTNLTGNSNYLTGVTGQYLITGTNASDFVKAGVLGVVGDQTTTADAAVVAYLDGDGGLTTANAAYGVSMKNSTPGSGFKYGLDLQYIDFGLGLTSPFANADIRLNNGVEIKSDVAGAMNVVGNIVANNIGNISSVNIDGNAGNILYGNGVFAASPSVALAGDGGNLSNLAGANVSGNVGSALIAYSVDAANVSGLGNIATVNLDGNVSNVLAGDGTWIAAGGGGNADLGNLQVTGTTIGIANGASETAIVVGANIASLTVDTDSGVPIVNLQVGSTDSQYYEETFDYTSGTWVTSGLGGTLTITGYSPSFETFLNNLGQYESFTITINGSETTATAGYSYGGGSASFNTVLPPGVDPTTVNNIVFNVVFSNKLLMDPDDGTMGIYVGQFTLNLESQRDVRINAGDDFSITANDSFQMRANSDFQITTDYNNAQQTWTFDSTGTLTTPGDITVGGDITGSAAANTLILKAQPTTDTYIQLNSIVDSTVRTAANLEIVTDSSNTSQSWSFTTDGNLVLAGGNSVIQSIANSSLDPLNPNVSTMTLTPDANYNSQVLVLDPTAPGHIHLRAFASSNIDEPSANIFLGGENTSFEVTSGSNNVAKIHSGSNTWTFGNDGNLVTPGLTGTYIKSAPGGYMGLAAIDDGGDQPAQLVSINSNSGLGTTAISAYANNALIQANINGDIKSWNFDNTGNLTLPGNTFAINYANGTQVSLGGGGAPAGSNNQIQFNNNGAFGASGNYTFTDTVGGGTVLLGNELTLLGNGTIGTANSNLNIQPAGNLIVTSSAYNWTFDIAGNLSLPGNTVAINFANGAPAFGNIAGLNTDGNASNILYGNGVFAASPGVVLSGDGGNISNIAGANVTGTVANANMSQYINVADVSNNFSYHVILSAGSGDKSLHVDGTNNLQYDPSEGLLTAIRVDADYLIGDLSFASNYQLANVVGVGNIASLNITGNASQVLYGNGVFAALPNVSLTGDGGNLSNLAGANVSGEVSYAAVANSVAAANVSGLGNISTINLDGNASNLISGAGTFVTIPVVPTVGNIATLNLDGNSQTWLAGNGVFANIAIPSVGNIATLNLDGNASNLLYGNGVFAAAPPVPAVGSNTQITFNDNGTANGSANLTFDKTTSTLSVVGNITANNFTGTSANVTLVAGSYNYTFDNAGTASMPGNLTVTGNANVSGISSNIIRRAFGLVASDVGVTLDDLTVTVSSATSQLTLSTSGSWQGTGWTETFAGGGTPTVNNWVNLPLNPGFNNASGAMTSQGHGCRCVISDQTPSAKVYQITVVRSGTTGAQWNISIERLV